MSATVVITDSSQKTAHAMGWSVMVWNDQVNTFDHVISSLMKVVHLPKAAAEKYTKQVHEAGCAAVWIGHKEYAEAKAFHLCQEGINATIEKA